VSDEHGCLIEADIIVETANTSCIDVPNTFTPNGDLYNDTWIITNIGLYPEYELHVFNKWGNEVYNNTSNSQNEWDGTHYGNPLPSDVYYYILKLNNADDIQYSGTITLLR
jgi:gliding motility-associated-like protein